MSPPASPQGARKSCARRSRPITLFPSTASPRLAPHHSEPGLLGWWFAGRTEKVLDGREAGGREQPRPAFAGEVGAVALSLPALVFGGHGARVRAEKRAFGRERSVELA